MPPNANEAGRPSEIRWGGMQADTAPHVPWTPDPEAWMDDAACRGFVSRRSTGGGVDWFDLHPTYAERICNQCPVRNQCATRVLKLIGSGKTPRIGMWAGKSFGGDKTTDAA